MEPAKLDLTGCKYPMELHKLLSTFLNRLTYKVQQKRDALGWKFDDVILD